MKLALSLFVTAVLLSQSPKASSRKKSTTRKAASPTAAAAPKPLASNPGTLTANTPLATLNGKPVTAGSIEQMLHGAPDLALQSARSDPKNFLVWSYTMNDLAAEAEKRQLHEKTPYKDRLAWTRNQVLMMAAIEKQKRAHMPSEQEARAWHQDNVHTMGSARVRIIYVARQEGRDAEAKQKLDQVLARLKSGADFAQVAGEFSDDDMTAPNGGEFGPIEKDSRIHPDIRKQIFRTKPGAYTEPIEQVAGYYIFQTVAIDAAPFETKKDEIMAQISESRTDFWMAEQRRQAEVKILNTKFFDTIRANSIASQAAIAPTPGEEVKPDTLLATLGGANLSAQDFTSLMMAVPPQVRNNALQQSAQFLEQVSLMQRLAAMAESEGIDRQQPYAGRLRYNRNEILTQAVVDDYNNNIMVGPDDPRKAYDADTGRFRFAKVRVLYVAFSLTPPPQTDPNAKKILNEEEARLRAGEILKDIQAGADFVNAVKDYSDDEGTRERGGELPLLFATDPKVPDAIKQPVFGAKPGDVIGPVQLPNGFYLVKVEETGTRPFAEVKDQLFEELRAKHFQSWFDGVRNRHQVEITDPAAFRKVVGEPAPAK
jgi:parvulin-like peptidyl-prolyl isomerase